MVAKSDRFQLFLSHRGAAAAYKNPKFLGTKSFLVFASQMPFPRDELERYTLYMLQDAKVLVWLTILCLSLIDQHRRRIAAITAFVTTLPASFIRGAAAVTGASGAF